MPSTRTRSEIIIRPYRADDASAATGFAVADCVGFSAVIEGKLAGFGGIHGGGGALWAVLVLYNEEARSPFLLHRLARKLFSEFYGANWRPVFAACNGNDERAVRWVSKLGFVAVGETLGDWLSVRRLDPRRPVDVDLEIWRKD